MITKQGIDDDLSYSNDGFMMMDGADGNHRFRETMDFMVDLGSAWMLVTPPGA